MLLFGCALASRAAAQERAIPFWPDEVPAALHAQVDGTAALQTVRELARFHRVQGTAGYAAAADYVRQKALAAGLSNVAIESFPADGVTRYAHFRSYPGWKATFATLEEVSPQKRPIAAFPELAVALADYSQEADVTAELVDVGKGIDAMAYAGKDVRGKLVLADGSLPAVHQAACVERGAAGIVSAAPNQVTAWSGDDRDLIRWGHLDPYQPNNRFAFMVSKRQAEELRARLSAGEKVRLHAQVRTRMAPGTYDVVVATIPGSDPAAGEVVVTAHLCHESAGANDNASGSAAILEVARGLATAIRLQTLTRPRRTIRFLWLPEISGSQAYLIRHPELVRQMVGGVHMDMVGGLLSATHGTFHLSRTVETLPHAANEIARAWFDHVVRASSRYAERGGSGYDGLTWPGGSREAFVGDVRKVEMGSDHQVFQAGGFRVPMVYFHDWPDVTIHTQKDQPENLDATKLGRVAYMGAGIVWTLAALPDSEAPTLLRCVQAAGGERIARALAAEGPDAPLLQREAVREAAEALGTVATLWPSVAAAAREEIGRLDRRLPAGPVAGKGDLRVPVRSRDVVGPLDVYYFSYLGALDVGKLSHRDDGEVLAYEAMNLVDGNRSISEIRDILTGRYAPVPLPEISEYFDVLAKAKAVSFR